MQQTRLNLLVTVLINRLNNFFNNPWRKLSLILIALLGGFVLGPTISSSLGQTSVWDPSVALVYLVLTETINLIVYRNSNFRQSNSFWMNVLNGLKMGFIYALFLQSFVSYS